MINDPRLSRLEKVLSGIAPNKRLAIAFSGGLDSRFLSFAAKYLGYTVKLLTVRGPHISAEETAEAVQWAQDNSFEMELLDLNPLQMEAVVFNHTDRCYFCTCSLSSKDGQRIFRSATVQTIRTYLITVPD